MAKHLKHLMKLTPQTKQLIKEALWEDIGKGDITTDTLISKGAECSAVIIAKSNGILAGNLVIDEVLHCINPSLRIQWKKKDGALIRKGQIVCQINGLARSILKAERTALNFLGWLSGIASETHEFVRAIRGTKARIYDTRKTTPLWRELEKYAVRLGGGLNHRMGLWDQGFIKDNHWQLVRDTQSVAEKILGLKSKKWVVEISHEHLARLETILRGKPAVILLDNFSPKQLKHIVLNIKRISKKLGIHPALEASGGIHLNNVRQIARAGVDRISIGAITHSASSLDFSLEIKK